MSGFLILFVSLAFGIYVSIKYNRQFQQENPDLQPYRWGYFNAVSIALFAVGLILEGIKSLDLELDYITIGGIIFSIAVMVAIATPIFWLAITIFNRSKIGWGIYIVLQALFILLVDVLFLNDPEVGVTALDIIRDSVYLIINIYYIQLRWHELGVKKSAETTPQP